MRRLVYFRNLFVLGCSCVGTLVAQTQFARLGKQHLPIEIDGTVIPMVLHDIDGDGDLDVLCPRYRQRSELYRNDGLGHFTASPGSMPNQQSAIESVAFGDVDADGDDDLVIANSSFHQNLLYLNDGKGNFTDATSSRLPKYGDISTAVVLGDVDGDGDLDVVFGNAGVNQRNRLLLNNGKGVFTDVSATHLPQPVASTGAMALVDVDRDGDLDLFIGNHAASFAGSTRQNWLYLNDGRGRFTDWSGAFLPKDNQNTVDVAVGDVNGDGLPDVVCGNSNFGQNVPNTNKLWLNRGLGIFKDVSSTQLPVDSDETAAVELCDVDGDKDLDLVCATDQYGDSPNRLYLNDGKGRFSRASSSLLSSGNEYSVTLVVGDVDSDGDIDVLFGNGATPTQRSRLYFNLGNGHFVDGTETVLADRNAQTVALALGDLDADGDLDIVCGNYGEQNRAHMNDGEDRFQDETAARLPADSDRTRALILEDMDNDGDLDLVSANYGQQNRLLMNSGKGIFVDATASRMPSDGDSNSSVASGDVDGDGDLDLVFGGVKQQNRLYQNDGKARFADASSTLLPKDSDPTYGVALGDVDGDGDLDLLYSNYGAQNRLLLNDGKGKFTDVTALSLPKDSETSYGLVLGDVDADGDLDVVIGNAGQNRLYINDGKGHFSDGTSLRLPVDKDWTYSVVLADADEDGDLDLFCASYKGQDRLYLNDGRGNFKDVTAARLQADSSAVYALALGDVDADGDLDLVHGSPTENRLFVNLQRQVHAPFLAFLGRNYPLRFHASPGYATGTQYAAPFLNLSLAASPLPLPPLGDFRLNLSGLLTLPVVSIPSPTGSATLNFPLPNIPALLGQTLYTQALFVHRLTPLEARFSNVVSDRLVR